jgi:hypothetical protein
VAASLARSDRDSVGDCGEIKMIAGMRVPEIWRSQVGEAPTFSSPSGSKRKFYAVRWGYVSGIYHTWEDCRHQVDGFSGQEFKSFKMYWKAED